MDLTTREDRVLAQTDNGEYFPEWIPSGDRILYGVSLDTEHWELWTVNADGT